MDNKTQEERSYNMSHIRSSSKPEEIVRKFLFSKGLRYRKNDKRLPGKPDIVLPKYKTVVFVHGCFWHKHDCPRFVWPSSNQEYWQKKITNNVKRDIENIKRLKESGWRVIIVWECELKNKTKEARLNQLYKTIIEKKDI